VHDLNDQDERRQAALRRVRDLARSGWYDDYQAVEAAIRISPDYPLIAEWLADEMFQAQIDQFCADARKANDADRT
jgi:hypothetical protein